jgi:7-cyano-7-deazaguanine synthase
MILRPDAVAVVSGGMDSVTMLYMLVDQGLAPRVVSFNYGQKHAGPELAMARYHADLLKLPHNIIDLFSLQNVLKSALTDPAVEVPEGHYAADNMKATVVPNRNMIMMSIAAGILISDTSHILGVGVHAGDHAVYPDCRPEYIVHMETTLKVANEGFIRSDFQIFAPFVNIGKHDIVTIGSKLGVDYDYTWSCYKGGSHHCGKCGTCVERKEAFVLANVQDPTEYEEASV